MANWVADFLMRNPDMSAYPIASRARSSLAFKVGKTNIYQCLGAPIHYFDAVNGWQPIDTQLQYDSTSGEYYIPAHGTRLKLDGTVKAGTRSQRSGRVGDFNPAKLRFSRLATIPNGLMDGDSIRHSWGQYEWRTIMRENGVREELQINSVPTGVSGPWLVIRSAVSESFVNGPLDAFWSQGYYFPFPNGYDANGDPALMGRWAAKSGNTQYVYTGVSLDWLQSAAYPVVIDPDYSGHTGDGRISGMDGTYSTARSTSSSYATNGTTEYVGQFDNTGTKFVYRIFLKFDTSGINDSDSITQVNLKAVCTTDISTDDFDVQIAKYDWSAYDPLSADNREAAYDGALAASLDDSIWRNTSGISTNTQYTSGNLSTAWPSKTGYTYYALRSSEDTNNSNPTGFEAVALAMQDNATEAYRPLLAVTTEAGASGKPWYAYAQQ